MNIKLLHKNLIQRPNTTLALLARRRASPRADINPPLLRRATAFVFLLGAAANNP